MVSFKKNTFFLSEVSENLHSTDVEPVEDRKRLRFLKMRFLFGKVVMSILANAGGWFAL